MDRDQAQARIDRIHAFREELATLEQEQHILLAPEQSGAIRSHHDALLAQFAAEFDADVGGAQKQLSMGMRIASFFGALAFSAAVYLAFLHFWGGFGTAAQVLLLVALPVIATVAVELAARRERTLYFASLLALVAFAAFVLDLSMLGQIFNVTPTQNAFLAWGLFALLLAYGYQLKLLLVAGLASLMGYLAATVGTWAGCYWLSFGERPENFIAAGALVALVGVVSARRQPQFAGIYRVFGMLAVFIAMLILATDGAISYLPFDHTHIEHDYQIGGFALAALTVWTGIRRQWPGVTNLGSTFFVIFLYTKLYDWWWEAVPKYLFFTLIGLVALLLLLGLRRVRALQREGMA